MSFKYSSLKSASVLQIAKEVLLSLTCAVFIAKAILWYWRFQLLKFTTICLLRSLSSVHFIHVSIWVFVGFQAKYVASTHVLAQEIFSPGLSKVKCARFQVPRFFIKQSCPTTVKQATGGRGGIAPALTWPRY